MFRHQALPRQLHIPRRTPQIRKKFSPKGKQPQEVLCTPKNDSKDKNRIHHISSKEKPRLDSPERSSKGQKSGLERSNFQRYGVDKSLPSTAAKPVADGQLIELPKQFQESVICRIHNRAIEGVKFPLFYQNLSLIDASHWHLYYGETRGDLRQGYGTQIFVNGEKFMGFWLENQASGQGTFYSLSKKIMGIWDKNKLKEVICEL